MLIKDLHTVYYEIGGTQGPRGSVSARVATGVSEYIMLKSDYDMTYLILIHYEAEICEQSSEAGGGEPCIVENLCMVLWVMCIATPLWRHNDYGVTKSTQNVNANKYKWEMFGKYFYNYASMILNEINGNS